MRSCVCFLILNRPFVCQFRRVIGNKLFKVEEMCSSFLEKHKCLYSGFVFWYFFFFFVNALLLFYKGAALPAAFLLLNLETSLMMVYLWDRFCDAGIRAAWHRAPFLKASRWCWIRRRFRPTPIPSMEVPKIRRGIHFFVLSFLLCPPYIIINNNLQCWPLEEKMFKYQKVSNWNSSILTWCN